jgi:hypothetical protein
VPLSDLSIADLSIAHSVCEVRYEMAYLIFDRTGAVCMECKERFPNLKLIQASPASTSFSDDSYSYWVEQTMSRVNVTKTAHDPKEFGERAKPFFEIALRQLEVSVFTRLGLRQVYFKTFAEPHGARDAVMALNLQPGAADTQFGIASPCQELVMTWESKQHGAMIHVVAVPGTNVLPVIDVRQIEEGYGKSYKSVLNFDVDYFTTAPVLRSQFDAEEWIVQSSHVIKKGLRGFLAR